MKSNTKESVDSAPVEESVDVKRAMFKTLKTAMLRNQKGYMVIIIIVCILISLFTIHEYTTSAEEEVAGTDWRYRFLKNGSCLIIMIIYKIDLILMKIYVLYLNYLFVSI